MTKQTEKLSVETLMLLPKSGWFVLLKMTLSDWERRGAPQTKIVAALFAKASVWLIQINKLINFKKYHLELKVTKFEKQSCKTSKRDEKMDTWFVVALNLIGWLTLASVEKLHPKCIRIEKCMFKGQTACWQSSVHGVKAAVPVISNWSDFVT